MEMARPAGIAWAMTGLLRAYPHHLRHGRLYLPRELLARHAIVNEALLAGGWPEAMKQSVEELVGKVAQHIQISEESLDSNLSGSGFIHYLNRLTSSHLRSIIKCRYDLRDPALSRQGMAPVFHLLGVSLRKRITPLRPVASDRARR